MKEITKNILRKEYNIEDKIIEYVIGKEKLIIEKFKEINEIKEYVGYNKISIENDSIENDSIEKKDPRVQLNFSAIGDGLSCDIIARYLDSKGKEIASREFSDQ